MEKYKAPEQFKGKEIIAEDAVQFKSTAEAVAFYQLAKKRLMNVNDWHKLAGAISAVFQLVDKNGKEVSRPAEEGDYFKIDIPGPGSKAGEGFDWVKTEQWQETKNENGQSIGFTVRPVANPTNNDDSIAHFYDAVSTSSFIVQQTGTEVKATIIDRNIEPNNDTSSLSDKLRHTVVGITAIARFSKIQWQNLAEGLIKRH